MTAAVRVCVCRGVVRNYVPYWSQIISKEVQRGAAREIVDRVREEANAREQARARGC